MARQPEKKGFGAQPRYKNMEAEVDTKAWKTADNHHNWAKDEDKKKGHANRVTKLWNNWRDSHLKSLLPGDKREETYYYNAHAPGEIDRSKSKKSSDWEKAYLKQLAKVQSKEPALWGFNPEVKSSGQVWGPSVFGSDMEKKDAGCGRGKMTDVKETSEEKSKSRSVWGDSGSSGSSRGKSSSGSLWGDSSSGSSQGKSSSGSLWGDSSSAGSAWGKSSSGSGSGSSSSGSGWGRSSWNESSGW